MADERSMVPTLRQLVWKWDRRAGRWSPLRLLRLLRRAKWFVQRGRRGYSDCDTWSLDFYLSRVIRDSVTQLRDRSIGHPAELTQELWDEILGEIAEGMQAAIDIVEMNYFDDASTWKETEKRLQSKHAHAMDLLKEYYFGLWD